MNSMKKFWLIGLVALALPATAAALTSSDYKNASKYCKAVRADVGTTTFRATYGTNKHKSNAFGKCVSGQARVEHANHSNAVSDCRDERAEDTAAFNEKYGTGRNGSNALGKCVSQKSKAASDDQEEATVKAAKACRTERSEDAAAFKAKYGTNRNKSNAFGKCVSKTAKELSEQTEA